MSTFANKFLKALSEETEGNAFTGALHNTKKGEKAKVGGKEVTNTTGTIPEDKEGNAFTGALHSTKKGEKAKVDGKEITNTTGTIPENKKWIQHAHAKKGGLHKALHVKQGEKIPAAKLNKALHSKNSHVKHMAQFAKNIKGLKENVMEAPAADAPAQNDDTAAWEKSLDKGTDPKDFETPGNPQHTIDTTGIQAAHEWIQKLEEMAHFINGTGPESLNTQINQLEIKNSVPFRGIVRREEKRITKLAENLRGLAEVFKSVVITSEKKIKDVNSPR